MTYSSCSPTIEKYGADPAIIQWSVVRGDSSTLRIQFFENDEITAYSTTGWSYISTAYNPATDITYTLNTAGGTGYVDITALPNMTDDWGTGYSSVIAELSFDLQITKPDATVWTPIIGTISVLSDITGGSL
jgi:hypothetical protein